VGDRHGEGMSEPHVVILGGGPAGCGAAWRIRALGKGRVTLLEQRPVVGGNAGSFAFAGQWVDYGSHRLHHACDPEILRDVQALLGDDLRDRERHGRIRLRGRWLHFPLKTQDLLLRLDRRFALGVARDVLRRPFAATAGPESFASVLRAALGPTLCEHFYFPYARKIWGREPEELSAIQSRKRVSAGSFAKLVRRLLKPPGEGRFYYPRRGYGQLSEAYADAAREAGAEIRLGWRVTRLRRGKGRWTVEAERDGARAALEADHVWSTLPLPLATRLVEPGPPAEVLEAASRIDYRAMLLVYLQLDVDRFSATDAHYFPEAHVAMTRLSEPKNYFGAPEPRGSTVLCAELPCAPDDEVWSLSDGDLARRVADDMARAGLPLARPPLAVAVRRLRHAYPIYSVGYEAPFAALDAWSDSLPGFLTYGRQGLFAHDNTHHAFFMAYCAAACLEGGKFDRARWNGFREIFETHVVED